jgi:hypothetical protein
MRFIVVVLIILLTACASKPAPVATKEKALFDQVINIDARHNGFDSPIRMWLTPGIYQIDPISPLSGGIFTARHAWAGENSGCDRTGMDCLQGWQWTVIVYTENESLAPLNRVYHNGKKIVWVPGPAALNMPPPSMFAPRATADIAFTFAPRGERFRVLKEGFVLFFDVDRQAYDNLGGISFRLHEIQLNGPDSDGDMYADHEDAFPNHASARLDTDQDGYPDRWNLGQANNDHKLSLDGFPYDNTRNHLPVMAME